jgi:hypothetical protein
VTPRPRALDQFLEFGTDPSAEIPAGEACSCGVISAAAEAEAVAEQEAVIQGKRSNPGAPTKKIAERSSAVETCGCCPEGGGGKIGLNNFRILKMLGRGAFGEADFILFYRVRCS